MNPDLEKLKVLQEVDREIQRLNEEVAALPARVAVIETKLAEGKAAVEKHKAALKDGEVARRRFETDIQAEQQKISKYREQSLAVKTNDQYKALMHEIGFAEQAIRSFEDRILQTMVDAEGHDKSIKSAEVELKAQSAAVQKEKAEAHARTEEDRRLLDQLNGQRSGLRAGVSPGVLEHYDRVLAARKTALAEALAQNCSACHVLLRPQKYDEIKTNSHIMTCDSCSRILYYDPSHEPAPEPPKAKRKKKSKGEAGEPEIAIESGAEADAATVAH